MKKLILLTKENNTKKMSYGSSTAVDANELMFNGSVKFYWLKKKLKYFKYWKYYDYDEFFIRGKEYIVAHYGSPRFIKGFLFFVIHNPYTKYLGIYLQLCNGQEPLHYLKLYFDLLDAEGLLNLNEHVKYVRSFDLYRNNSYLTQHFKKFICIWTRLTLQYENFEMYEKFVDEFILYKENIKKYVQIIEVGSWFRKQCWMHQLPIEV
jgi:hypothetical protein